MSDECQVGKVIDPIMVCLWSSKVKVLLIIPRGIFSINFGLQIVPFMPSENSWMICLNIGPACLTISKPTKEQDATKS